MDWYKKILKNRDTRLAVLRFFSFVPDRPMIRLQYFLKTGHVLRLRHPRRYTEKLQWYKLYYRDPLMIQCVDKADAWAYVASLGLESILNPVIGVYDTPEEIDFQAFPQQFVLKDTLGSGGHSVILCEDKAAFDAAQAKRQMRQWVREDHRAKSGGREWPYYSGKKHRIIAEAYIPSEPSRGGLMEYKFFCFQGKVAYLYVIADRQLGQGAGLGVYTEDFQKMEALRADERPLTREVEKPQHFDAMKAIASKLSERFPHARVDLYDADGRIVFGEITFFDGSGYMRFQPDAFDLEMGERWALPAKRLK